MRDTTPNRSPRPPADKILLAVTCLAGRDVTVTTSEAEIAAQARVPEPQVLPALRELERRGDITLHRARKEAGTWLVVLEHDAGTPGDTITVPWADPIEPPSKFAYPPMPPELPLPFYWGNRKVARSLLMLIGGLQALAVDGLCRATLAELCLASGLRDPGTVKFHLSTLQREGVIRAVYGREYGRAGRAFELLRRVEIPPAVWPGLPAVEPAPQPETITTAVSAAPPTPSARPRQRDQPGQLRFAWVDGTA